MHSLGDMNSIRLRTFTAPRGKMGQAGLASKRSIKGAVTGDRRNNELEPEVGLALFGARVALS